MEECKSLEDYLVKPGEQSPFANLLVDLAFKKAFDPDKPTSRENLVNLLNDLLAPQLKRPIKNVWTRNVSKNLSGSKASRTAIFDLHCEDDAGELIEIEVQIRKLDNFLNRLKELPPAIYERKFKQLTESSKVSKFSKEEFEAYQKMFHAEWDHNALKNSFFEEFADDVNAKVEEGVANRNRESAKRMIADGKLSNEEIASYSGLSIEDIVVLRSQAET